MALWLLVVTAVIYLILIPFYATAILGRVKEKKKQRKNKKNKQYIHINIK